MVRSRFVLLLPGVALIIAGGLVGVHWFGLNMESLFLGAAGGALVVVARL
jgi:hypothetical protein